MVSARHRVLELTNGQWHTHLEAVQLKGNAYYARGPQKNLLFVTPQLMRHQRGHGLCDLHARLSR